MNRYASITSPGADDILVKSPTPVDVKVDQVPAAVATSGNYRSASITATNTTAPAYPEINIQHGFRPGGSGLGHAGATWNERGSCFPSTHGLFKTMNPSSTDRLPAYQHYELAHQHMCEGNLDMAISEFVTSLSYDQHFNPKSEVQRQTVGAVLWCARAGGPEAGCIQRCCPEGRQHLSAK